LLTGVEPSLDCCDQHRPEVDSIVDLTAVGLGRFIPRIARVAQRTQPNIIIATGIYTVSGTPPFSFVCACRHYIGMEGFGLDMILPFGERLNTVAQMCRRAHAESMVLSRDTNRFFHWAPRDLVTADLPRWHDRHIHDDVIPALRQRGVTDEQIHTMLVENPRNTSRDREPTDARHSSL
jgi:predicted metal-dependent phosphotriesterase family hydrolase